MTIKRKIFISNIMTLIIPLVFLGLVFMIVLIAFVGITEIDVKALRARNSFNRAVAEVSAVADDLTLDEIKNEVTKLNSRYEKRDIGLYVYSLSEPVFGEIPVEYLSKALVLENNEILTGESTAMYKHDIGQYSVVTIAQNYPAYYSFTIDESAPWLLISFALIGVIMSTCLVFGRYLSRSITTPIKILTGGTHELRDGHLSFRLKYDKTDEFSGVVEDFNQMADRLESIVQARQKDETNRRELIAGISHDLRTPLTSIRAYVEGIEKGVASTEQSKKKYFDTIKSEIADLEHIINQLFLFSKLDIGAFPFHLEKVDIGNELQQLVSDHKKEYENRGLTLDLSPSEQMFALLDVVQLRNVIHNIWNNSVKYKSKPTAESKIECMCAGTDIVIRISDDGPGVSEGTLENIFNVFYRDDSARTNIGKGSGLGLAISKKIVERFGGEIHAENVVGGGLAVVITLPRVIDPLSADV